MPHFLKTCLITHTFPGASSSFTFNIRNQINTDILYDEIKVNYIAYNTPIATATVDVVSIYVQELQQWIGSVYNQPLLQKNVMYSLTTEKRLIPQSLTFNLSNGGVINPIPFEPVAATDISIMLTFIKHTPRA